MQYKRCCAGSFLVSLFLVFGLVSPPLAWATIEEDQTPATEDEVASALARGEISVKQDEAKSEASAQMLATTNLRKSSVSVQSFSGATMFETAVAEARAAYPSGSPSAVIVGPGDAWVDALSAAGLAASRGPILFTWQDRLEEHTAQALADLGVRSVVVVGGTSAVSDAVVSELAARGVALEARLAGEDCYGTQAAIYRFGLDRGCWSADDVLFATGTGFGDALSASPVAFAERAPVFLVDWTGELRGEQKDLLLEGASRGYGRRPAVVGGSSVVSDLAVGFAEFASALAGGSGECPRVSGANQYETSAAVAAWAVSSHGFSWDNAAFATGYSPYDALAGSVLQGSSRSVLLLVGGYDSPTADVVADHSSSVRTVRFLGGEGALDMRTRMGVADAMGFPYAAIPGFKVYVDAGHGWNDSNNGVYDPGASGNGCEEATLTRELAQMVGNILTNDYGVEVFVNDDGGWYKLRHAEAVAQGCDAIVSLHFNAGGGSGSESLIHNYNASFLSPAWQDQIHPYFVSGTGLTDRGKKQQEVAILGGYLPATLLEICFIDNDFDMGQYQSRKLEIAYKIAEGIVS